MAAPAWYTQEDKDIFKNNQFITQKNYRVGPYTSQEDELTTATGSGIPYTNAFTGGGGGGGGGGTGNTFDLIGDFNKTITDREARINEANRPMRPERRTANYNQPGEGVFTPAEQPSFKRSVQDFVYDKVPYIDRPQSYKDIMTKGYQEPEGPGLPTLFNFLNKMGVQNFGSLPQSDQAFIKSQSGYRGPTVFGENTGGHNVDPFGLNVESMFGNYANAVSEDHTKLSGMLSGKLAEKYGVEWDEETGQYIGANAAKANKMTKALRSRWGFRKNQVNKQSDIKSDLGLIEQGKAEAAKQADQANIKKIEQHTGQPLSDYRMSRPASERQFTGHGKSGMGRDRSELMAAGGRIGFKDGAQFEAANQGMDISPGTTAGGEFRGGDNTPNINTVVPKNNYIDVKGALLRKKPYLNINARTPLDMAKLKATFQYKNLFDNDNLSVKGNLSTKLGKFNTNTDFTEAGIGDTSLNYNNLSALIGSNKNIKNIGYNTTRDGINYGINYGDGNTMFTLGTQFNNGGLARLL